MNTYEISGYESSKIVATIICATLDEASAWAFKNLGAHGWGSIFEAEMVGA